VCESERERRGSPGTDFLFSILLTPGVNFINIPLVYIRAAFERTDPKGAKKTNNLTVFFGLTGSARVKAALRTLMKLATGVNFINIPLVHVCKQFLSAQIPKAQKDRLFGAFRICGRKSCS